MSCEPTRIRSVSLPNEPTDALPGSEEKIRVMIERASRREPLFHPQDGPEAPAGSGRARHDPQWPEPFAAALNSPPFGLVASDEGDDAVECQGVGGAELVHVLEPDSGECG